MVEGVKFAQQHDSALDLGAGALVDSKFLLESKFKEVIAVDMVQPPILLEDSAFQFIRATFAEYNFPDSKFDLVNANLSLPFAPPETFSVLWENIKKTLSPGGVFCGQLFGVNDDWHDNPEMNFHTQEGVQELLRGVEVLKLEEIERDAPLALGGSKHWHIFAIIYRK